MNIGLTLKSLLRVDYCRIVLAEFIKPGRVLPTARKADRVNDGDSIHARACTRQEVGAKGR